MSTDAGIKLFGKTIAMSSCSEEGGEDCDKCSPKEKEPQSTNTEEKTDPITVATNNTCETEMDARNAEENQNDHSNPQGKPQLKKPDKILACPRCKSMETKFCYYNNYNINQPRHFCKNCQRYWTAGGTMRNVPVGAGRRRSKSFTNSQFQHLIISDAALKANGSSRVLSFGSDAPLCVSNEHITLTSNPTNEYSSGANLQWAPWPYPWAAPPTPIVYPRPTCWAYGTPWISPIVMASSSSASTPVSPLGKHLRETNVFSKEYKSDSGNSGGRKGNVWIPKTLRINDPEEAAKSSIWATMGFDNNDKSDKGLFKVFPNKSAELKADSSSHLFNVNPASLSRSVNFQESS